MEKWQKKAIEEGRVCPECQRPVSKEQWADMTRTTKKDGKIRHCWTCQYAHWETPLSGRGGSVWMDNSDREVLDYIRGKG